MRFRRYCKGELTMATRISGTRPLLQLESLVAKPYEETFSSRLIKVCRYLVRCGGDFRQRTTARGPLDAELLHPVN